MISQWLDDLNRDLPRYDELRAGWCVLAERVRDVSYVINNATPRLFMLAQSDAARALEDGLMYTAGHYMAKADYIRELLSLDHIPPEKEDG